MTEPTRRIDALCDAYVDDFCALDPLTATSIGVAGHEHEMTDYSPAGFDAREALARAVVAAVEAADAGRRPRGRGQGRLPRAHPPGDRARGRRRQPLAHVGAVEPAARDPRRLRPDADRGRGGRRGDRGPARRRTGRARGPARHALRRGPQGQRRRRPAVRRGGRAGAPLDRADRRRRRLLPRPGRPARGRRPHASCARWPGRPAPPRRRSASSSATSSSRRARTRRAWAARSTASPAATSSAPRSTSTRPTRGAGPSCSGSPT